MCHALCFQAAQAAHRSPGHETGPQLRTHNARHSAAAVVQRGVAKHRRPHATPPQALHYSISRGGWEGWREAGAQDVAWDGCMQQPGLARPNAAARVAAHPSHIPTRSLLSHLPQLHTPSPGRAAGSRATATIARPVPQGTILAASCPPMLATRAGVNLPRPWRAPRAAGGSHAPAQGGHVSESGRGAGPGNTKRAGSAGPHASVKCGTATPPHPATSHLRPDGGRGGAARRRRPAARCHAGTGCRPGLCPGIPGHHGPDARPPAPGP